MCSSSQYMSSVWGILTFNTRHVFSFFWKQNADIGESLPSGEFEWQRMISGQNMAFGQNVQEWALKLGMPVAESHHHDTTVRSKASIKHYKSDAELNSLGHGISTIIIWCALYK